MSFQDHSKNSVQSLLALLRTTQDDSAIPLPSKSPRLTQGSANSGQATTVSPVPTVPSSKQLTDLIATLNRSSSTPSQTPPFPPPPSSHSYPPPPPPASLPHSRPSHADDSDKGGYDPSQPRYSQSAFEGSRTQLIEPFGPVGMTPPTAFTGSTPPRVNQTPSGSGAAERSVRGYTGHGGYTGREELDGEGENEKGVGEGMGGGRKEKEVDMDNVSFSKALPVITALISDESFLAELKKMKVDQDALERRLYAKAEKIRSDHVKTIETERELARVLRRPISRDKEEQWESTLASSLGDFHRTTVLPSIDGLGMRQREKLRQLGVPGLGKERGQTGGQRRGSGQGGQGGQGGEGVDGVEREREKDRVRRVMDVLDAALEDAR